MKTALVTGSCGLVGSAVAQALIFQGWAVHGLDSGARSKYFGPDGSVGRTQDVLATYKAYTHLALDLRDREAIQTVLPANRYDLVVHAAAQPSHDLAAKIPFVDFEVNAYGTLVLLELARCYWPEAPFVFLSTNKVYGDGPNQIPYFESATRFEIDGNSKWSGGISESFRIDKTTHSLFGCSKTAADLYVQEYGRYFGMPTVVLRCGCLTGESHAGVKQHGFLAYLAKRIKEKLPYVIYGYGGKQVRDNLYADDVASFVLQFYQNPKKAAVYNLGGGYENSCSVLEAIVGLEEATGQRIHCSFVDEPRVGDHRIYYSDLMKVKQDYPGWGVSVPLKEIYRRLARCQRSS